MSCFVLKKRYTPDILRDMKNEPYIFRTDYKPMNKYRIYIDMVSLNLMPHLTILHSTQAVKDMTFLKHVCKIKKVG